MLSASRADSAQWDGELARGPLVVEVLGTPGAGKTTVVEGVEDALRLAGWKPFSPERGARPVVARTILGSVVARLPWLRLRDAVLWRLFLVYRVAGLAKAIRRDPKHFLRMAQNQRQRPDSALVRRRRVVFWYLRTVGSHEFFARHAMADEAVVFDEGQMHRVVQLFSSPGGRAPVADVRDYLEHVPQPHLVVLVQSSTDTCLRRIRRRGVWERLRHLDDSSMRAFISCAAEVVGEASRHARDAGWRLVEVDNEIDDGATEARQRTARLLSSLVPVLATYPRPSPIYRLRIPSPSQLRDTIQSSRRSPGLSTKLVDSLMAIHRMERRGPIRDVGPGRRSRSVAVATDAGKVVIRAYAPHWTADAMRYEHSILTQLAEVGYPATRLLPAPGGETLTTIDDERLAVFRFARGVNLSGALIAPGARLRAYEYSGGLLGRLHKLTAEFEPEGHHHLAMVRDDDDSRLRSHLVVLDELASRTVANADEAWLQARAGGIARRLTELFRTATVAGLRVSIIHGDFGLHNILMCRDDEATVHDFELARRDWCLVDVAEMISRVPTRSGDAFVRGYLRTVGELAEWVHLPRIWELHRVGGAIRSWQSYVRRGDPQRLVAARTRLAEAEVVAAGGAQRWL